VTCKGGLDGVSLQEGVATAKVTAGFGGDEKSSFFPLHVFIPSLKYGGLCLGVRCSYLCSFFVILGPILPCFSLIIGRFIFLIGFYTM